MKLGKIYYIELRVSHPLLGDAGEHTIIYSSSVPRFILKLLWILIRKQLPDIENLSLYINGICVHRRTNNIVGL